MIAADTSTWIVSKETANDSRSIFQNKNGHKRGSQTDFRQTERSTNSPSNRVVINNAKLERIPLHCSSTSTVKSGKLQRESLLEHGHIQKSEQPVRNRRGTCLQQKNDLV